MKTPPAATAVAGSFKDVAQRQSSDADAAHDSARYPCNAGSILLLPGMMPMNDITFAFQQVLQLTTSLVE